MHDVFDALAHPVRRALLDLLRERDGRTQGDLGAPFELTRFAVMKHLGVLEEAGLVVTRKVGREKLHFLNPVPIQEIGDRWISRYATPFVRAMADIRAQLENKETTMTTQGPRHVYETYIRAPAQAVWDLITDDARTPLWQHFDMTSKTELRVGGSYVWSIGDRPMVVGELVEITPPTRLIYTFSAQWSPEVVGDTPSRVTWEIVPLGESVSKLVLTHDNFGGDTPTSRMVGDGWPEAMARLKTLIETGEPLVMPKAG